MNDTVKPLAPNICLRLLAGQCPPSQDAIVKQPVSHYRELRMSKTIKATLKASVDITLVISLLGSLGQILKKAAEDCINSQRTTRIGIYSDVF